MGSALVVDRLQFAFTITYHYLFPQLTSFVALLSNPWAPWQYAHTMSGAT